jgi:hypothetical protein
MARLSRRDAHRAVSGFAVRERRFVLCDIPRREAVTEAAIFAGLLVLAVAGWAWFCVCMSRSVLLQANAQKVMQAIVDREDAKVASLVERVLTRQNRGKVPEPSRPTSEPGEQAHPMADMFRVPGAPSIVVDEQPDADGLEIRES